MEGLYNLVGVSRQGFHKRLRAQRGQADEDRVLLQVAERIRSTDKHPRMGCREMYFFAKKHAERYPIPFKTGRKAFEKVLLENGFRLVKKRVFHKTTVRGAFVFPNVIGGAALWGTDMVWVSDITYFEIWSAGKKTFFYLTVILDVYSRRCIGWSVSFNLQTENTSLPALEMALKNDYLIPWNPKSLDLLKKLTPVAVHQYNFERPHSKLGRKTPFELEQNLAKLPLCQRTFLTMKVVA